MELSDTSFGNTKVPWNSMELIDILFGGTRFPGIQWNIPWNPIDLGDFFMIFYLATPEFREFRGIFLRSPV